MNTNSKDVVKNVESNKVESTSNEQRQTNKPIVISRRRLLRAGVAGIPVVLTMAGHAPAAEDIRTLASAASGLVYSGDGVGVHDRFKNTEMVSMDDNLVWSDSNGFVINKTSNEVFTEEISTQSRNNPSVAITLTATDDSSKTKTVTVTPKALEASTNAFTFNAYLHKSGFYYTDFDITKIGSAATSQTIQQYFQGLNTVSKVLDYFTFTVDGSQLSSVDFSNASVTADVSVTYNDSWTQTTGFPLGTDSGTTDYYRVPNSSSATDAFTVTLKINASISKELDYIEGTGEGQTITQHTFTCSNVTTDPIALTFTVSCKPRVGN